MKKLPRTAARELKKLNDLIVGETCRSKLINHLTKHIHNGDVPTVTRSPEVRLLLRLRAIRPERIIPATRPFAPSNRKVQVRNITDIGRPIPGGRIGPVRGIYLLRAIIIITEGTLPRREVIVVIAGTEEYAEENGYTGMDAHEFLE